MAVAYAKLSSVVWSGESIDMYTNSIRIAGFNGRVLETIVKMAFINGFANHISIAL